MKIGISSYCFQNLFDRGEMTVFDEIAFAAQTGFQCIEFTNHVAPETQPERIEWARQVRACCETHGLEISTWTVWADFLNSFDGDTDAEVERVKGEVDVCEELGAKLMRHDATWGFRQPKPGARTVADAIWRIAPAIREVTEYAARKGIRTCSENHGYFIQDSDRVSALIDAVNHENYGWLVDMGNFACADEDSARAVGIAAPYAFHVHAKDFLWKSGALPCPGDGWFPTRAGNYLRGTIVGHGIVPVEQCIRVLKKAGYDGTVSLEFEGPEDICDAIKLGYAYLRRCIGE